eukprot:SAG31_NODE_592_length_13726_cov_7.188082_1_plen_118_part_10
MRSPASTGMLTGRNSRATNRGGGRKGTKSTKPKKLSTANVDDFSSSEDDRNDKIAKDLKKLLGYGSDSCASGSAPIYEKLRDVLSIGLGPLCFYFCAIMLLSSMLSSRFWSAIMLPIM